MRARGKTQGELRRQKCRKKKKKARAGQKGGGKGNLAFKKPASGERALTLL